MAKKHFFDEIELKQDIDAGLSRKFLREKYKCSNGTLLFNIRKIIPNFSFKPDYSLVLTKEFLEKTDLSFTEITKTFGISSATLWKYIKKYDITYCKNKKAISLLENKDWLFKQYIVNKKSIITLTKELRCGPNLINKYLKIHNIPKKERYKEKLSDKFNNTNSSEITNLYKTGFSCLFIAEQLECNPEKIRKCLKEENIEIRNGVNSSTLELKICKILDECNISYIRNTRKIIFPCELDIYIESHNIAIEINGVYFHSNKFLKKDYHENKRILCEQQGIRLIQLFEDDITNKFEIVESIIKTQLTKSTYLHARNCSIIHNIPIEIRKQFLNKYHIQGFTKSSSSIGLTHKNELVALMLFEGNVLTRFATSQKVLGGFSKLLKNSSFDKIISFVDLSLFTGETYLKCGFYIDKYIKPDYKYIINNKRVHKFNFRKSCFNKKGFIFEPGLTETQLAEKNNINKIYDAGKLRLIWKRYHPQEKNLKNIV